MNEYHAWTQHFAICSCTHCTHSCTHFTHALNFHQELSVLCCDRETVFGLWLADRSVEFMEPADFVVVPSARLEPCVHMCSQSIHCYMYPAGWCQSTPGTFLVGFLSFLQVAPQCSDPHWNLTRWRKCARSWRGQLLEVPPETHWGTASPRYPAAEICYCNKILLSQIPESALNP